jgi:hypothetical protein
MTDPSRSQPGGSDPGQERGFTLGAASESDALPIIDFSTFVLSLGASAMQHMGIAAGPAGAPASDRNLPLARQTIDTLEMLERKTRGNLDEHEEKLIQTVLYELRMAFVRAQRSP